MKSIRENTAKWFVQTNNVKEKLVKKYNLDNSKVECLPFYELMKSKNSVDKIKNKFVYVSLPYAHKNHNILIDAFSIAYKKQGKGELHLTIDNSSTSILKKIDKCLDNDIPVYNHGILSKSDIKSLYCSAEYLIFPSLAESFGLPLIESINYGCKVLAADKKYVDAVCVPSMKFNASNTNDIVNCIEKSIINELPESEIITLDKIDSLIKYLV
tara:strand:- start:74 stop:712 length:639 start_codon:yes stop_codon:yes gene_type:complete